MSMNDKSVTNIAAKASSQSYSSSTSLSELSYKTATSPPSPPPQQHQQQHQHLEINNCVYELICTQCRRPFTFSFQLKHKWRENESDNKIHENCTHVNNHDSDSTTNEQTNCQAKQAAMRSDLELEKERIDHTTRKTAAQDWYNEIVTEMHELYNTSSVLIQRDKCDVINVDMIAHAQDMIQELYNKMQNAQTSVSTSNLHQEHIDNSNNVNTTITSEEEMSELLYCVEQVMCYLVTHYGLKQPLCTECWNEQELQSMITSATSNTERLQNLVRLLPEWNSEEMRCMCNSIKIMHEEYEPCKYKETSLFSNNSNENKKTFFLDTAANNLFSSAEGVLLLSTSDDDNNNSCYCCEYENENAYEQEKQEIQQQNKESVLYNTCPVSLTCHGPDVLVLSSTYNKHQSLLNEVEDAERAAMNAEKVNNELQHKLITLQNVLTNRHELHHEWDEMNRYRAMCDVSAKYKYMDEAAKRHNNINANVANLHDVHTLPLYVLTFPIDVRGDIATIDGLRLGFIGSNEKMQNWEEIYSFLNEHYEKEEEIEIRAKSKVHQTNQGQLKNQNKGGNGEMYHQFMGDWQLQKMQASPLFGKLTDKVSIGEVSTACGLLCELLVLLAQHHSYSFSHAILHPHGAQSTISLLKQSSSNASTASPEKPSVNVIGSVDFYISERFFAWRTFPSACEAIADCVNELCRVVELKLAHARNEQLIRIDSHSIHQHEDINELMEQEEVQTMFLFSFPQTAPYRITKGSIDGMCIRHGSVSETAWSLAMKKLLTNVQWCVAASALLEQREFLHK